MVCCDRGWALYATSGVACATAIAAMYIGAQHGYDVCADHAGNGILVADWLIAYGVITMSTTVGMLIVPRKWALLAMVVVTCLNILVNVVGFSAMFNEKNANCTFKPSGQMALFALLFYPIYSTMFDVTMFIYNVGRIDCTTHVTHKGIRALMSAMDAANSAAENLIE
jgi:hypothetical protein